MPENLLQYMDDSDDLIIPEQYSPVSGMPTKVEYRKQWEMQRRQSLGRRAWEITKMVPGAMYDYFSEAFSEALADDSIIAGLSGLKGAEEQREAGGAVGQAVELGTRDMWRLGKTIYGNVKDYYSDLTDDEAFENAYERMRQNFEYNTKVREAFANSHHSQYAGDIKLIGDFVDITTPATLGAMLTV